MPDNDPDANTDLEQVIDEVGSDTMVQFSEDEEGKLLNSLSF